MKTTFLHFTYLHFLCPPFLHFFLFIYIFLCAPFFNEDHFSSFYLFAFSLCPPFLHFFLFIYIFFLRTFLYFLDSRAAWPGVVWPS
jgi:hypothetical protein